VSQASPAAGVPDPDDVGGVGRARPSRGAGRDAGSAARGAGGAARRAGGAPDTDDAGPDGAGTDGSDDAATSAPDDEVVDPSALDELGGYIRHQRESAALSLRKLAKIAGVSNPYLSQIERGLRKPSAEILQAIAKALEISSETLYVKAGILEEREDVVDVEDALARDPHLTDAQRQALTEMYRSFKRMGEIRPSRPSRRRQLLDAVTPGGLDDAAVRAASLREEEDEA
jgi:transcriptional regulator with XRE-family HTH domain